MIGMRAVNAAGESGWTNSAAVPAVPPPPHASGAVTNLSTRRENGGIVATWNAVDGATKYHITYSTDGKVSWSLAAGEHTTNSIVITNADGKLPHNVGVRAGNARLGQFQRGAGRQRPGGKHPVEPRPAMVMPWQA